MRGRWKQVTMQGETKEIEEMMESYLMQCENATKTGKGEDLPKILETKLDEQKRERQDKALGKASSPPKTAGTAPTPTGTTKSTSTSTMATASASTSTVALASVQEGMEKSEKQVKEKEKQEDEAEVVHIKSDTESTSVLMSDEPAKETP